MPSSKYLSSLILVAYAAVACAQTPDELVQSFQLTQTASLPIPTATATNLDTQTYLTSNWGLARARIQEGADKLSFVNDPYPDKPVPGGQNVSGPVLQAFYPSGSFSHDTGGAQFTSLFNSTSEPFLTMMVSYEVAFEEGFEFVKGGKLPGLRGGTPTGCSGGSAADGKRCFSARLMWRKNALGEAYVYMPTPHSICNRASFDCNDDFGISISRGAITFTPGEWQRITILARLNNPPNVANGDLRVYWNDAVKISQQGLQFRSADNLTANGFFFSTFFGGADDSWATPKDIHTYYRNIRMWGSTLPSNLTGEVVPDNSAGRDYSSSLWATAVVGAFVLSSLFI